MNIKDESGWWQGQIGDAIGWFPANFVVDEEQFLLANTASAAGSCLYQRNTLLSLV